MTLTDVERLGAFEDAERTFQMDEETFRLFYERTARALWLYLARTTASDQAADDLLQEVYFRFLRARVSFESDDHRRNYLFRIATNLVRDGRRRSRPDVSLDESTAASSAVLDAAAPDRVTRRLDLLRSLRKLTPRERSLLWLAYAEGLSHAEIASVLGLQTGSLKTLLFRARQRLMQLLRAPGGRS